MKTSSLGGLNWRGGGGGGLCETRTFPRFRKNANQQTQIARSAQRILISPEINPHFPNFISFSRNVVDVQTQENTYAKSGKWHSSADHIVHRKFWMSETLGPQVESRAPRYAMGMYLVSLGHPPAGPTKGSRAEFLGPCAWGTKWHPNQFIGPIRNGQKMFYHCTTLWNSVQKNRFCIIRGMHILKSRVLGSLHASTLRVLSVLEKFRTFGQ